MLKWKQSRCSNKNNKERAKSTTLSQAESKVHGGRHRGLSKAAAVSGGSNQGGGKKPENGGAPCAGEFGMHRLGNALASFSELKRRRLRHRP